MLCIKIHSILRSIASPIANTNTTILSIASPVEAGGSRGRAQVVRLLLPVCPPCLRDASASATKFPESRARGGGSKKAIFPKIHPIYHKKIWGLFGNCSQMWDPASSGNPSFFWGGDFVKHLGKTSTGKKRFLSGIARIT